MGLEQKRKKWKSIPFNCEDKDDKIVIGGFVIKLLNKKW